MSYSPPPGISGQVAARSQRDIFEEGSAPSSAAPSSILSSWEDLHSDISRYTKLKTLELDTLKGTGKGIMKRGID